MKRVGLTLIVLLSFDVCGQSLQDRDTDYSTLADDLIPFQEGDGNYEELYENLVQLLSQPIDLNRAEPQDLRVLPFLNEKQIQQLDYHRRINGALISIYELQTVPEFDVETIRKILPYVKVSDPVTLLGRSFLKRLTTVGNTYLVTRYSKTLEAKSGFVEVDNQKRFLGNSATWYTRFRSSKPGEFSFGVTAEQDAGEKFEWDSKKHQYGFDFISAHAQVMNKGKIRNLVVGDFHAQFGQGLILGGGFGIGKGGETITSTKKNSLGFSPYTSANESGFMRGIASTVNLPGGVAVSAFYSRARRDGTINETDSASYISSFLFSGLHRNELELSKRQQVVEQNYGGVLSVRKNAFEGGAIVNRISFGEQLIRKPNAYNQFAFQGNGNTNAGVFLNYNLYNYNFFGEVAHSLNAGTAAIAGVIASLSPKIDFSLSYRNYGRNFYAFYSNAFAESSAIQNETAVYWGWKYQWKKRITVAGYVDLFKFPWVGFRRYTVGSMGHEWLFKFTYQTTRKISMFAHVREEVKEQNSSQPHVIYQINPALKRNYIVNLDYAIHSNIRLKSRVQISTVEREGREWKGSVFLQDIHIAKNRWRLTARYAIFDTESPDNRQYVYENDVWLAYSMPAYDGVGIRSFVVVQYKVSRNFSLWIRFARTRYADRDEIGSGVEQIKGNRKNDIKLQARFTL
jgi:hypothetical protein